MWRYFTGSNTHRYCDVLNDLVNSYNSTKHRSIKIEPRQVNEKNVLQIFKTLNNSPINNQERKYKFNVGDYVRVSRLKHPFEKGYASNFSEEIFKIIRKKPRHPVVYEISDLLGEQIEGVFYELELQKVSLPEVFKIERIIKSTGVGKNKKLFIKWQGYPDKFNSWVNATELHQI